MDARDPWNRFVDRDSIRLGAIATVVLAGIVVWVWPTDESGYIVFTEIELQALDQRSFASAIRMHASSDPVLRPRWNDTSFNADTADREMRPFLRAQVQKTGIVHGQLRVPRSVHDAAIGRAAEAGISTPGLSMHKGMDRWLLEFQSQLEQKRRDINRPLQYEPFRKAETLEAHQFPEVRELEAALKNFGAC